MGKWKHRKYRICSIAAILFCVQAMVFGLAACGSGGTHYEESFRDEAYEAYTESEKRLHAQLGLLSDCISDNEWEEALYLVEEIDLLREERLAKGEYEKGEEETELLKQLNDFYDGCTELYLVEDDQYYEEENTPETKTLAEYRVGYDGTLDPDGGRSITAECPWTDEKIRNVWQEVMDILPSGSDEYFARLEVFTDGEEEMLAYVEQADDVGVLWTLAVDPADYEDEEMFREAIVHEFFHCVTLNEEQTIYTDKPDVENYTEEYEKGAFCIYPEGSYIDDFYETFWTDYIDDRETDPESEYFYLRHEEDFVTDYAAVSPAEDICESFAYFVLYDKDGSKEVWQQKIDFFYDYPELVEYREEIRENLAM